MTELASHVNTGDITAKILLAPITGFHTSYQYIQAARCGMERKKRIVNLGAFLLMSARATLTDPGTNAAAGATLASFIAHMRAITESDKLSFINFSIFSKLTEDELIQLIIADLIMVGGSLLVSLLVIYVPRIGKTYLNFCKRFFRYGKTFDKSKIVLPFKYLKKKISKLSPSILLRNKLYLEFISK
jgi:hypothetical protein